MSARKIRASSHPNAIILMVRTSVSVLKAMSRKMDFVWTWTSASKFSWRNTTWTILDLFQDQGEQVSVSVRQYSWFVHLWVPARFCQRAQFLCWPRRGNFDHILYLYLIFLSVPRNSTFAVHVVSVSTMLAPSTVNASVVTGSMTKELVVKTSMSVV